MFDLQEEYASLAQHLDIDWDALAGRHVLVTGATGLIGSLCARTLLERNRLTGAGIIVDALVRDPAKAQAMLGQYTADDGLVLHQGSLEDVDSLDLPADYVIHTACPTASSFFMSHPVETFSAIVDGTRSMLELARRRGAASFVYVSSMEIYGMGNKQRGTEHLLDESAVGYIDPCSVRSCYSEGKRAAENLCVSYHSESVSYTHLRAHETPKASAPPKTCASHTIPNTRCRSRPSAWRRPSARASLATTSACSRRSHATPWPARTSS